MKKNQIIEKIIHGIFLITGLITVACVALITLYLVISGIPAIGENRFCKLYFRQSVGIYRKRAFVRHNALYTYQFLRNCRGNFDRCAGGVFNIRLSF